MGSIKLSYFRGILLKIYNIFKTNYGGRVTDDKDRKLLKVIMKGILSLLIHTPKVFSSSKISFKLK